MLLALALAATTACAESISFAYDVQDVYYVDYCGECIALRAEPSAGADEIASIPLGAAVLRVDKAPNGFAKVLYNGLEGYALDGYLANGWPEALRVVNCEEWVSLRESPSRGARRMAKLPFGQLLYSGYAVDGFISVAYGGYGYVPEEYLYRADNGTGVKRYAANCGASAKIYRYATIDSDVIGRIPAGEALMCYSANNADMVYVNCEGDLWGFVEARYLAVVPAENRLVSAKIEVNSYDREKIVQTIADAERLRALNALLAAAEPGEVGKCPMNANLTLEMDDGTQLAFIYPTDGCSSLVGEDSRVYAIPASVDDAFWEIFDAAWRQILNA